VSFCLSTSTLALVVVFGIIAVTALVDVVVVADVFDAANAVSVSWIVREIGCSCNATCTGTGFSSRVDVATVRGVVNVGDVATTTTADDDGVLALVWEDAKLAKWSCVVVSDWSL
jgi:hypothetical protein